ncbi:MAG TPA: acyltransferase [Dehalococcoidia bacterium]|nr:acyltransferase [Dehalococcoidia bacterium]
MAYEATSSSTRTPRERNLLYYLSQGWRSPSLVLQVLRARWQLRNCDVLPLTVRLRGRARVEKYGGHIELGERVRIEARTVPVEMVAWREARLSVGEGTFINYGASLSAHQEVRIGANCMIGNYVVIMDSDYHDLLHRHLPGPASPIVIEDEVWIGVRATILKGVRIGQGSVIGAGSVVTTNIPPWSVAFGVPARVVRSLTPPA